MSEDRLFKFRKPEWLNSVWARNAGVYGAGGLVRFLSSSSLRLYYGCRSCGTGIAEAEGRIDGEGEGGGAAAAIRPTGRVGRPTCLSRIIVVCSCPPLLPRASQRGHRCGRDEAERGREGGKGICSVCLLRR
ncbi:hypothetical protein B0H63DRAFT_232972 [Podospora didyma]|uniref:Uncharacterized protein n=1 Tax=Podospora didyma TaxID=330526 RepID=A0AAE0KKA6_9PEZI|nr:hypothetical protein B0H63DRAFT_232972 [Podospora didyma]